MAIEFLVSVIVPVYNGETFIEKAIVSIVQNQEVFEIIVINDGSTDKTEEKLKTLSSEIPILKVFYHKNKSNKGRSASRNLGILKAKGNFISFLDADDFYLNDRFKNDKIIFEQDESCDGVYNAIGAHFYRKTTTSEKERLKLTTISKNIAPDKLFDALLLGKVGHFSIDGLTVRKQVFDKTGLFNEDLLVSEDTELFYKMALKCNLKPGIINMPVAKRGVHNKNVSGNLLLYSKYELKMYESLFFWTSKQKLKLKIIERFLDRIWIIRLKDKNSLIKDINYWIFLIKKSPNILFTKLTIKYFPLVKQRKRLFKNV